MYFNTTVLIWTDPVIFVDWWAGPVWVSPPAGSSVWSNAGTDSNGNPVGPMEIEDTSTNSAVPEPASVAELGIGLAGCLLIARSRADKVAASGT